MKDKKFKVLDVSIIAIAHHIHDIFTSFLARVEPIFIETLGVNHTLTGFLPMIQRIPTLMNPFIGILADRIKLRFGIIFAPTITAISMSLMGIAPNYTFLAIIIFISGISSAFFHVPTPVMVKMVSGNKVGRGMSFYMFGGELARTVGPIIIIGAIDLWGFENTFRLIPMGLLATVILYIKFRNLDLRKNFEHKQTRHDYKKTLKKFLPVLLVISGITFSRGAMKSALTYYLASYFKDMGASEWIQSIALSTVYLSGTAGAMLAGTISDFFGRKKSLILISVISPFLFWWFIHADGVFTFPLLLIQGFFLLAPTPVILAVIHEVKTDHLPFVNGVYMTVNFLVSALTTLFVGFGIDIFDHLLTYKMAALLALLAIPMSFYIPDKK